MTVNGEVRINKVDAQHPAGGAFRLLRQCREHADTHLRASIKEVVNKCEELLLERSNGGVAEADNALQALRLARQDIEQKYLLNFGREHAQRLEQGPAAGRRPEPASESIGLSLIDEKELEESLVVEGLIGKSKEWYRNQLYALTRRYQAIVEGVEIQEDLHPLAPAVFCHAFRDAFDGLGLDISLKLILYKVFEQHALKKLGTFYDEVNEVLIGAGVLPQLKSAVTIRQAGGSAPPMKPSVAAPDLAGSALAQPPQAFPPAAEPPQDVYQTLQRLMSAKKYGAAAPHPDVRNQGSAAAADGLGDMVETLGGYGVSAGPPLPAEALIQGLSLLQHLPPPDAAGESSITYIKAGLLQQLGDIAAGKAIDPAHDNTIDVIGLIFEFILDEPSIPDEIKRLLNQLQIPILKVALVDKEFFTNKQHPARRLLNTLGHAGIGWTEKDAETQRHYFEQMEYVVGRVLNEYQTDPGIFAELLESFTAPLAAEDDDLGDEKLAQPAEQKAPTPEQRAFEIIALRLEGAELPRPVREFLRDVWQRVMVQVAVDQGVGGEAWQRRYQTLDDLLWSVEPKKSSDERRRMVALLPRLLSALRNGMQAVGCEQREIDAVLNVLQPIHMACLRGEAPPSAPASGDVTELVRALRQGLDTAEAAVEPPHSVSDFELKLMEHAGAFVTDVTAEADEPAEDEFTATARGLSVGAWLEFVNGMKKRRGKLGWKSAVLGQYVFVDRRYRVVVERTLTELAADLRSGRAQLVTHLGMFDRALDKVLSGLMAGVVGNK